MTTTKTTQSEPTGTKPTNVKTYWVPCSYPFNKYIWLKDGKDGYRTLRPMWCRRVQIPQPVPILPAPRYSYTDTGDSFTRFWVGMDCILVRVLWATCNSEYLRQTLAEEGIHLRWYDKIIDRGSKNGIRDVYLHSTILEKLYERESTTSAGL